MAGVALKSDNFTISAPGSNTNILSTSLTPTYGGYFQVFVTLTTGSVFNAIETRGGTSYAIGMNKSTALVAGDGYVFSFPVSPSSTYNFQVETDSVIRVLRVMEVSDPVGLGWAQGNAT